MTRMSAALVSALALAASCKGDDWQPVSDAREDAPPQPDAPPDTTPDGPPDTGLVLHYAFEDTGATVTDASPRGKHGTLSDPAAWTASGRTGRALSMSGANPATQYVTLPDGVLTGVEDFTITVWVKLQSVLPWARIYDFGNGATGAATRFMYLTPLGFIGTPGVLASSFGGDAAAELVTGSGTALPTGVWKHVAVVGTGGTRKIYIDGFPAAVTESGPVVPPREMEPLSPQSWLGKSRFPDAGLDGTLDDFRIYRRVLSDTEIADLAAPERDYAHWRFDEGSGLTAKDSSAHAVPTVLSDGAAWTTGRLGGALRLPGGPAGATGPTVTLAANPLAGCTTELTVAAWVKLDALEPWARIFDFGTATERFLYLAPTDGAGMHFAMVAPSGVFDLVTAGPPLPGDGTWHHVAVTVRADGMVTLYADGASVLAQASPNVRVSDFTGVTELWLGKSRFPDPYLSGAIDELRIGCRALTADEILNLSRP